MDRIVFLTPLFVGFLCLLPFLTQVSSNDSGGSAGNDDGTESHNCTYFSNNRSPTGEGKLVNCTWYSSKSCCKRTEVTSVFSNMDPLYGASVLCRNYVNYLMCYFCSPDQYKFYKSNMKAMVCPDYCDALYEECKTAGFNKTTFEDKYDNGTAFCQAQDFDVVDSADCFKFDPDVFGSATGLHSFHVFSVTLFIYFLNMFGIV